MSEQAERFYSEWYANELAEQEEQPKREFIVVLDLENADIEGNIPIANTEPIVRCRDCKYLEANKYGYEIVEDDCGCIYWDADFALGVAPEGFCAWGVRRDA